MERGDHLYFLVGRCLIEIQLNRITESGSYHIEYFYKEFNLTHAFVRIE